MENEVLHTTENEEEQMDTKSQFAQIPNQE